MKDITDKASGFTLEAKKQVAADASAFDFLRHTVAVTYRTDVDDGEVTICGSSEGGRWNA
jgi:hypothetical protein